MRIRQLQMLSVRNSLRELLRIAITTLSPQASVTADDRNFDKYFGVRHAAFLNISLRKFPQDISAVERCPVTRFTNQCNLHDYKTPTRTTPRL